MRHLLFFLLFLSVSGALAQDYQLVRSDMVRFYSLENIDMHGIRIDSVSVENGDSVLYNYLTLREGSTGFGSCYYVNAPSMIGRKVVIRPDGETLMFNRWGDTLTVLTQAALQDTWTLMTIGTDTLLRATVSDISQQEWLGITDMVKTIAIHAVDGSGQDIDHPANGSVLLIGQQLGLLSGFDLFYFPYLESWQFGPFNVIGMEEYGTGMRRLASAEIYDLDLCDEFHFRKSRQSSMESPPDNTYSKRTVVSRNQGTNSVTYQFQTYGCRYHFEYAQGGVPPYEQIITPIGNSIVTVQYPFKWDAQELLMPLEQLTVSLDSTVGPDYLEYHYFLKAAPVHGYFANRVSNHYFGGETINVSQVVTPPPSDCESGWETTYYDCDCLGNFTPTMTGHKVAEGLGRISDVTGYFYDWQDWHRYSDDLVYYNKCGEEWGNPISEGLLTGLDETASTKPLSIHPNPASSVLRFDSPASTAYTVLDAVGRTVMQGQSQQGQNTLSVDGLRDGMYVLRLEDGSGAVRFVKAGQ